jgi:TMEM175 potassium channel family protein
MEKNRLEAFSDGVIAIIITIMVLELKAPEHSDLAALKPLLPNFLSYVLSFIYVGIYWNNHHHMLQSTRHVTGGILWANLHLLFWLSLFPFATAWVGQNHFESTPTATYGVILLLAAIAYVILQRSIIKNQGSHSILASAVGRDLKGKLSLVLNFCAILLSFVHPWISNGIFVLVALIWFIPDRRIERTLARLANENHFEHKEH